MKCIFCDSPNTVYNITEEIDGASETFEMCAECGKEYMKDLVSENKEESMKTVDLTSINTPEALLNLIFQIGGSEAAKTAKDPCRCGMTSQEFESKGRFGCPHCYDHFQEEFDTLVVPYQKSNEHVGKRPKPKPNLNETPEERIKTLKLRLAKASEIEDYETAAKLKKELDAMLTTP